MSETITALLEPPELVLSTLNRDGSRRWLKPRVAKGRYLNARRIVAYVLIAIFTALPHLRVHGKPAMLLDIAQRQFTFFGVTFLPNHSVLLALLTVGLLLSIFAFTALLGRVWCGWGCPQTVYLEFVYRPIERLFEGTAGQGGRARRSAGLLSVAKYLVYLLVSAFLAHTFLAYFVGTAALWDWMHRSPFEHPAPFVVMLVTTGLMMFNFSYFREQTCVVACPYGRFQSVLLDRDSLIISYDPQRGEPRGRAGSARDGAADPESAPEAAPPADGPHQSLPVRSARLPRGDCIDCFKCVTTCPTGIDIRAGLQLECVGCAQCIDACDEIMDKVGRPRGLIRYTSQAHLSGDRRRILRGRVVAYATMLSVIFGALGVLLSRHQDTTITVLRGRGLPYSVLADGRIANPLKLKIANLGPAQACYDVALVDAPGATLLLESNPACVESGKAHVFSGVLELPADAFPASGRRDVHLRVSNAKFDQTAMFRALGPAEPRSSATGGTP